MVITQGELKIEVPFNNEASSSSDEEAVPKQVTIFDFYKITILTCIQIPSYVMLPSQQPPALSPMFIPQYNPFGFQYFQPPMVMNYPTPGSSNNPIAPGAHQLWGWDGRHQSRKKQRR